VHCGRAHILFCGINPEHASSKASECLAQDTTTATNVENPKSAKRLTGTLCRLWHWHAQFL